jgi:hypothetical protein
VHPTSLPTLIPILQLAVGPVILVSGIGLLLVMLTNRFGRIVDRSRLLTRELIGQPGHPLAVEIAAQVAVLDRRCGILRFAILSASLAALLVAVLILLLFVATLLGWESGLAAISLFSASLLLLISSLVAFIRDMNLALVAIRTEIRRALPDR